MKKRNLMFYLLIVLVLLTTVLYPMSSIKAANGYLGITFGFNSAARDGSGGVYNKMQFKPTGVESDWWDAMVEQVAYSGVDFIAPVCRGYSPNFPNTDAGDPRKLPNLIAAMDRRGLSNAFKIAIFDDCPASWTANRNLDNGQGYGYNPKFDCADTANYKYIWDLNLKLCIQNIPDEKRFKINNRMVILFWTETSAFAINQNGNLKKILQYIRSQCQSTFGFNPYIIVDRRWFDDDPSTNDPAVVDAAHDWFAAPMSSWTLQTFNGIKTGCLCPGFSYSGNSAFMDPSHGQRLINGLNATVGAGAMLTLGEGFTDVEEEAAWWRSKDVTYYDYPNQRINITRRFTNKAYANDLKVEAEGCDFYSDTTSGNSGGTYRDGDIDIVKTADVNGGWHVTNTQANEWLEWRELPLLANTKFTLRYSATAAASVRFSVDGAALATISLPANGSSWATIDAGNYSAGSNGLHTVRLTIVSGSPNINFFDVMLATSTPTPTPTSTPGGTPLNRSGWVGSGSGSGFSNAFDGNASTRWSTNALQVNGQYFQVDMQSAKTFNKIRLDTSGSPNDYPRGYQVYVSNDATNWSTVANGAGSSAITDITFTSQTARYLKIVQTGSAPGNYWSIHEFNLYSGGPAVLFSTGLETGNSQPTWSDTIEVSSNVIGYLSGINPECGIRTGETSHAGIASLMFSGTDNNATTSFCYFKVFDVNIPITATTKLSYWFYPQMALAQGVAVDFVCTDGTTLRDSGAKDLNGIGMHPGNSRGAVNTWNQVQCNIGQWLNGKTIDRILVGYDLGPSTGQFRGFIDDIQINN